MTSVRRTVRRFADGLLLPVARSPRFFTAMWLLALTPALLLALITGQRQLLLTGRGAAGAAAVAYLFCSLLLLIRGGKLRLILKALILTLWGAGALIDAGCVALTHTVFGADAAALMAETTPAESAGFFSHFLSSAAVVWLVAAALLTGTAVWGAPLLWRRLAACVPLRVPAAALLLLTLLWGVWCLAGLWSVLLVRDLDSYLVWETQTAAPGRFERHERMAFADPLTKTLWLSRVLDFQRRGLRRWTDVQEELLRRPVSPAIDADFNIVVIVGESFVRAHSSLYGYPLPVNPRLEAERDSGRLAVFTDIYSPANFTTPALRNILNLNDITASERWEDTPFFPLVARLEGWRVCLFDNQTVCASSDIGIGAMLYSSAIAPKIYSVVNDRTFRYDGDFIGHVHSRLLPRPSAGGTLAIYHLTGQHFAPADRYPGEGSFSSSDIVSTAPWLTDELRARVAEYDNATLYNDSVAGAIMDFWRDTPTLLIYFSDHGETVADQSPETARNRQMPDDRAWVDRQFHIPFFVWTSEAFMRRHPQTVVRIREAVGRRDMTDNLGQLILGLAAPSSPHYRARRDLLSPSWRPRSLHTVGGIALPQ